MAAPRPKFSLTAGSLASDTASSVAGPSRFVVQRSLDVPLDGLSIALSQSGGVAAGDPVHPPAYDPTVTIPKSQALYEHELTHVVQYSRWGPFFHLGLPLFGIYEWDVILHGYQNAGFEQDARRHGWF